jgi:hypothetical protein
MYSFQNTLMEKLVEECDVLQDKALAQQLCMNQLEGRLHVQPGVDLGAQSLACLLTHLSVVLRPSASLHKLLNPLFCIAFQPAHMLVNTFILFADSCEFVFCLQRSKFLHCFALFIDDGYLHAFVYF